MVCALSITLHEEGTVALARTNLTLPVALMREVDEIAGPRGRSRYVAEAVAQRVKRDRLGKAIRETAGIFRGTPDEMTREQVSAWIEELRSEETD
jgi:metal-responsive CopG/Arc/MetJ family transcriptional regulator